MLSGVAGVAQWLLCVAAAAGIGPSPPRPAPARADSRLPRRQSPALWSATDLEGPPRRGGMRQREARRASDAGGGVARARAEAIPLDHDERARSARRRERARPP